MMEKTLESTTKVRFQDCDPFNHLNNSKYFDYFINAREDQILQHYNLDALGQIKSTGKSWVITGHQIAYIKPAFLSEEVTISSQLFEFTNSSLRVEMRMFDQSKSALKAVLWTTFTYFDVQSKRIAEHNPTLSQLFESIHLPIASDSFEMRCGQILMAMKSN